MTDRCPPSKLTYEALPSTLILDPVLLSLARQSYDHRTDKVVNYWNLISIPFYFIVKLKFLGYSNITL